MPGECHYLEGNLRAQQRVNYVRTLLEEIGLEEERVRMVNLSAAMGLRFAEVAAEMDSKIRELGPNPLSRVVRASEIQELAVEEERPNSLATNPFTVSGGVG